MSESEAYVIAGELSRAAYERTVAANMGPVRPGVGEYPETASFNIFTGSGTYRVTVTRVAADGDSYYAGAADAAYRMSRKS